jgi:hypothetical protein
MSKTLYVGNLLASATSDDIRNVFARFGTVTKARIAVDQVHYRGRSLGFGFVEMADGAEAAIAAMNGALFQGRALTVTEAQKPCELQDHDRFSAIRDRLVDYSSQPKSPELWMQIKDITLADIQAGKNWRVLNPNALFDDFPMECLQIEPLGRYTMSDKVVYSGILVYLKGLGQPRSGLLARLLGRAKTPKQCRYPPDDPKDLTEDMTPVVEPIVMIKEVRSAGWDYCEYVAGTWRQRGLKANPDAPLLHEYIANPLDEDPEFSACGDNGPIRDEHKIGFQRWIAFIRT